MRWNRTTEPAVAEKGRRRSARRPFFQLEKDATGAQEKGHSLSEVILAAEIAMLFLYLPFIIFEAWMLSPGKHNVGELDAA